MSRQRELWLCAMDLVSGAPLDVPTEDERRLLALTDPNTPGARLLRMVRLDPGAGAVVRRLQPGAAEVDPR